MIVQTTRKPIQKKNARIASVFYLFLSLKRNDMQIGYMRVSKNDGSQLLDLQRDALSKRGIGLKVLAGAGAQIDTTTANGRLIFGIFAALSEFEAELIRERTIAGLSAARARGRLGGRPRKMTKETLTMAMAAMADQNSNSSEIARRLGITTTTLYAYVNGDGTPKEQAQDLLK